MIYLRSEEKTQYSKQFTFGSRKNTEGEMSDIAEKYTQAIDASGDNDYERAYNLYKKCYESNYQTAKCAGHLGLLAFKYLNDIEETRVWLTRAISLGSVDTFVYLYLIEIYQGYGKTCPTEYYEIVRSRNTVLDPKIVQKIRTMCGQSPADFNKYKFG